jgi:hypothetical protein
MERALLVFDDEGEAMFGNRTEVVAVVLELVLLGEGFLADTVGVVAGERFPVVVMLPPPPTPAALRENCRREDICDDYVFFFFCRRSF